MWDVALAELARQAHEHVTEQGLLLERARTRIGLAMAFLQGVVKAQSELLKAYEAGPRSGSSQQQQQQQQSGAGAMSGAAEEAVLSDAERLMAEHSADVAERQRNIVAVNAELSRIQSECDALGEEGVEGETYYILTQWSVTADAHLEAGVDYQQWDDVRKQIITTAHGSSEVRLRIHTHTTASTLPHLSLLQAKFTPRAEMAPILKQVAGTQSSLKALRHQFLTQVMPPSDVAFLDDRAVFDRVVGAAVAGKHADSHVVGGTVHLQSSIGQHRASLDTVLHDRTVWGDRPEKSHAWPRLFEKLESKARHESALAAVGAIADIRLRMRSEKRHLARHMEMLEDIKAGSGASTPTAAAAAEPGSLVRRTRPSAVSMAAAAIAASAAPEEQRIAAKKLIVKVRQHRAHIRAAENDLASKCCEVAGVMRSMPLEELIATAVNAHLQVQRE